MENSKTAEENCMERKLYKLWFFGVFRVFQVSLDISNIYTVQCTDILLNQEIYSMSSVFT